MPLALHRHDADAAAAVAARDASTRSGFTWAWSIIVLTFIVRLALVPLTVKQQQSMRRMTALQPELKKLQAKYKHDRQMLNEKMMEFYRENNTNPFGSCLPIVVQIPIFIGLFYLLRSPERFIEPGDDLSFLFGFIPDITTHLKDLPTLDARDPDDHLRQLAGRLDAADAVHRRPAHEVPVRGHADPVRGVHREPGVPGRPDALLDHDQPVDVRPGGR